MDNISLFNYNPDILSCLANLSNDEVFTPPQLANDILNLLPSEIWRNKNATFLDPCCKTGVFLREISKRLIEGLSDEIPDLHERINHILTKQVFGIGITDLTTQMTKRSLYCSRYANGKYSICSDFNTIDGNIHFNKTKHTWRNGKCIFCGAAKEGYDRGEELETHAYEFIHKELKELFGTMKFDVIIGNPPYQLSTSGDNGKQARPLYHKFVEQAKKLNPRFITMIIPARWYSGGWGLKEFRAAMLNDSRIRTLVDYENSNDCFSGVDIAGGVCYFLWENNSKGKCNVINHFNDKVISSERDLNEFDVFIRNSKSTNILRRVLSLNEEMIDVQASPQDPFGIKSNADYIEGGDLIFRNKNGFGRFNSSLVTKNIEMIDKWKVITSRSSAEHAAMADKNGMKKVLSIIEILPPNSVCSDTYRVMGAYDNKEEAEKLFSYMKTKFVRFLISLKALSQDILRGSFAFVPIQDFTKDWDDKTLYAKYNLSEDDISFIESLIRPIDINKTEEFIEEDTLVEEDEE